jgi:RimJ/RimL family protein N-acetyltransferase
MSFIPHPVFLKGDKVSLFPMEESYFEQMWQLAEDARIWEYTSVKMDDKSRFYQYLYSALRKRTLGEQYQFAIKDNVTGKFIGSTMFHSIVPENKKLEIGWTWYQPEYWRTGVNRESKLLMLTYCFDTLKLKRVQFQTDELNMVSRNALLGIGATFEGMLRHERLRPDGTCRNTAMFSVIDTEWNDVKEHLRMKIK